MRMFATLEEAALEIRRDLAKSPLVESTRVQQFQRASTAREAMVYDYTIREFPETVGEFMDLGLRSKFWNDEDAPVIRRWVEMEQSSRTHWQPALISELEHPSLSKTLEGSEPSYTYTDRLRGAVDALARTLIVSPDTRRAFWPIFDREDAVRAARSTRIPCSLGYQALIRNVGQNSFLHLVYFERSCDFDRFWLTDLWLARNFQRELLQRLTSWGQLNGMNLDDEDERNVLSTLKLGSLSHVVVSLHSFDDSEIY